jgi:hypothetical protein
MSIRHWQAFLMACILTSQMGTPPAAYGSVSEEAHLRGAVTRFGQALANSMVVLQRFEDQRCAKIAMREGRPRARDVVRLARCAVDLPEVFTDAEGQYSFAVEPGWYAVRFLIAVEPDIWQMTFSCKSGDWMLGYSVTPDTTGKYNAMIQGKPIQLRAGEDKEISFDYRDHFRHLQDDQCLPSR